jgi:hypothetical protein
MVDLQKIAVAPQPKSPAAKNYGVIIESAGDLTLTVVSRYLLNSGLGRDVLGYSLKSEKPKLPLEPLLNSSALYAVN